MTTAFDNACGAGTAPKSGALPEGGGRVRMSEQRFCYWCQELLPPLAKDASYVDEINHYVHDECREQRDENNRRMELLRAGIADGSIDSTPEVVRDNGGRSAGN
jgi:hypothetical protein